MKLLRNALIATAAMGMAVQASAAEINLSVDDQYYVGSIIDGVPPGTNELNWLLELIALSPGTSAASTNPAGETLNRSDNDFGTLPTASGWTKNDPAIGTYTIGSDSLYVAGKYGAAFPGGQAIHVWYLGTLDVGDKVTLPGFGGPLSHDSVFSGVRPPDDQGPRVPDGGTTVALLGLGLGAIAGMRRFMRS